MLKTSKITEYIKRCFRPLTDFLDKNLISVAIVSLLVVSSAVILAHRIFIFVPAGYLGVLYEPLFGGVNETLVLKEGLRIVWPWNSVTTYDARVQTQKIDLQILTKDQLRTKISINFQYSINEPTLPLLHKYIGQNYYDKIVLPEVVSSTREIVGGLTSDDAFTTGIQSLVGDIAMGSDHMIIDKLSPPGLAAVRLVSIRSVQLESTEFPPEMEAAIQRKLIYQQEAQSYTYRIDSAKKEAERKVIEAEGIKKFQNIVNAGLSESYLRYKGIEATEKLSQSQNSKVVIIGSGSKGLPLIFGGDQSLPNLQEQRSRQ